MEFPRTALNLQRCLALLMVASVLGVALIEHHSPLSARLRSAKPWPFWLSVREPGRAAAPSLHLGLYNPVRRTLVLIRIPESTKLQGKLTVARAYVDALRATDDPAAAARAVEDLAQEKISALSLEPINWEGAGRLNLDLTSSDDDDEPAFTAARALKARGRSPRALLALARMAVAGALRGDRAEADAFLLALELRRTPLEGLQPALLPDDTTAPAFLGRVFASAHEPQSDEKAIVVEVLNGTDIPGLAAQVAKVLRLKGMDAMVMGQAPRPLSRTILYDRIGDFDRTARVRAALDCPTAITTTRIDALRGVDASVELGADCSY